MQLKASLRHCDNWSFVWKTKRPYLIRGLNLMIAKWVELRAKTTVFSKTHSFLWILGRAKVKNCKNHGFCQKLQFLTKNMVFSQKSTKTMVLTKNHGFQPKPQILQFFSLKLQHCWLVFGPERGTKGETSIFPWKNHKIHGFERSQLDTQW